MPPGGYALDLGGKGGAIFNQAVGSIVPLASLSVGGSDSAAFLNGGLIKTTGDQSYNDITLGSDTTLTSQQGNLNFNGLLPEGAINGTRNLTTNSYLNTEINGEVGNNDPLASLTANITGPGGIYLHGNTVTTTGAQTYNGPLTR
jgi:hypothetical protein